MDRAGRLMSFSEEVFCGRDETAVLELEEVDVLRERIGVEVDDKVDSMDLVERLDSASQVRDGQHPIYTYISVEFE